MLTSLLTQLLGKVAEAMLTHAKACNLPLCMCFSQLCWCMCFGGALADSLGFDVGVFLNVCWRDTVE